MPVLHSRVSKFFTWLFDMGFSNDISSTGYERTDVQWLGLVRTLLIWFGVWISRNISLRFGILSPNWLYLFERWIEYALFLIIMPILGMLGWKTWNVFKSNARS